MPTLFQQIRLQNLSQVVSQAQTTTRVHSTMASPYSTMHEQQSAQTRDTLTLVSVVLVCGGLSMATIGFPSNVMLGAIGVVTSVIGFVIIAIA